LNTRRPVGFHTGAILACTAAAWCGAPLAANVPSPEADGPEELTSSWLIAPYLWGSGFKGTVGLGQITVPIDVGAGDLFGNVDAGAMGYLRWTRGVHFIYVEGIGLSWRDTQFEPFYNQDVEGELAFAELGYGRHHRIELPYLANGRILLSPYAGLRYASLDIRIHRSQSLTEPLIGLLAEPPPDRAGGRWLDPAVGVIADAPLSARWSYVIKLDGAGFGLNESRYWNAAAVLRYRVGERWTLAGGYRAVSASTQSGGGSDLTLDARMRGPFAGISYRLH
jgi:hypothetical protein